MYGDWESSLVCVLLYKQFLDIKSTYPDLSAVHVRKRVDQDITSQLFVIQKILQIDKPVLMPL